MHCIMFRLSIFTMQLLEVGYHIFCEINVHVAHKELTNSALDHIKMRSDTIILD